MTGILAVLDALVNSLWQAVAVAALVWLVLRFAPRVNAATRHAIWWATLAVALMLPMAPQVVALLGSHTRPHTITAVATASKPIVPITGFEPVVIRIEPARTSKWPLAIFAFWAAILLWRTAQIGRSYVYLRGVKRRGILSTLPLPAIPRRASLLISRDTVSPMAVGFLRPAVVFPESLMGEISERDREHVLLHEAAHLARYDDWINLAMRFLGGALALHPVAIWILRRIEREREMICDDWVVARTGAAREYAASLAHLFELRHSRAAADGEAEALASGIFGRKSRLGDRIELLLRRGRTFSPRASLAGIAASALALSALLLASSLAPRWIAFAQQQQPGLAFEVASIKPSDAASCGAYPIIDGVPDRVNMKCVTLKLLAQIAYGVRDFQISGGPGWMSSAQFDIAAKGPEPADNKASEADVDKLTDAQRKTNGERLRAMLQPLLAERFQLKVHHDTQELPVYVLTAARGGPKLKGGENDPHKASGGIRTGPGYLAGSQTGIAFLAQVLSGIMGRTVLDRTGLEGNYDFELKWTPDQSSANGPLGGAAPAPGPNDAAPDPTGPTIFTALQEQLGLQLKSAKGPVETLVIDHVEKPDAN